MEFLSIMLLVIVIHYCDLFFNSFIISLHFVILIFLYCNPFFIKALKMPFIKLDGGQS